MRRFIEVLAFRGVCGVLGSSVLGLLLGIFPTLLFGEVRGHAESRAVIKGSQFIYYRVKEGETYESLARLYGFSVTRVRKYNHGVKLKQEALIRLPIYRIHRVRAGETFSSLAKRYRISIANLRELHHQKLKGKDVSKSRLAGNLIYVGEVLRLAVNFPSDVWLYSAYIRSQYKRIADLVKAGAGSEGGKPRKFSAELGSIIPMEVSDSLPFLSATEDKLNFSIPFRDKQVKLGEVQGFEISDGVFHPGIFYEVKEETRVRASEAGEVIFMGPLRGWGIALVVRHSGNFFSLYSGMKRIEKGLKAVVERDDVLGTTRVGMFFSLHYKGLPIDPLEFF